MSDGIRVGLLGCGVVGTGVVEVLAKYRERVVKRLGQPVEIHQIAVRDIQKERAHAVPKEKLCDDWASVCTSPEVDVVIEVMGGTTHAGDAIPLALQHGKHVITANKELLAALGPDLFRLAEQNGVRLECEASVLGGIPALHTLGSYFRVNRVLRLRGIVNGTCNYILTKMHQSGTEFSAALAEAQALGYAEPNPSNDIEGLDAYFKLKILLQYAAAYAPLQTTCRVQPKGISQVTQEEVAAAAQVGNKVKHLVQAQWDGSGRLRQVSVGPEVLTPGDMLYPVDGVQNALTITGDIVGEILVAGPGAGAFPTASAILEDLAKIYDHQALWLNREAAVDF